MATERATLVRWYRNDGDAVACDEPICELETSVAMLDLAAPAVGILRHLAKVGDTITANHLPARIDPM